MNAHTTMETPAPEKLDIDKYTQKLVALKDKMKAMEDEFDDKIKPYKEMRDKLEKLLLGYLVDINAQNISTKHGTIHMVTRKSASLKDPQAFMDYVIANNAWDLIDRKANANAVEDFIHEHNAQPPGVDFKQAVTLGLRRK